VELWDVSGAPSQLSTLTDHTNTVTSVALSADGKSLASASWDRTVSHLDISDPRDPKATASLSGPTGNVTAVTFDPRAGPSPPVSRTRDLLVADRSDGGWRGRCARCAERRSATAEWHPM